MGDLRKRSHLGDLDVDGRIILKCIFKKWDRGTNWIDLAQYGNRWRIVVMRSWTIDLYKMQGITEDLLMKDRECCPV